MLAKRWREHSYADAAQRLVTSHLRLVAKISGHHRQPEEAVLQPAQGQEPHVGVGGPRSIRVPGARPIILLDSS
jgi:hypothetical protein